MGVPAGPEASTPDTTTDDAVAAAAGQFWFNRSGVVRDAHEHAWEQDARTGIFAPYDSDCTNFVSQAWHFGGGLKMTKRWHVRTRPGFPPGPLRRETLSWVNVQEFGDYMVGQRELARYVPQDPSHAQTEGGRIGDAIQYDWGRGSGWSHMAVLTSALSFDAHRIDQHTTYRKLHHWNVGWLQETDPLAAARMKARIVHVKHR